MERRRAKRRARRVQVRVTDLGGGGSHLGFTTNVSLTGMFVATNHVLPPGSRVRVEIVDRDRTLVLEALIARAVQVPAMFRGLEHQGLGVRFLRPDELMVELLNGETPRDMSGRSEDSVLGTEAVEPAAPSEETPEFLVGPLSDPLIAHPQGVPATGATVASAFDPLAENGSDAAAYSAAQRSATSPTIYARPTGATANQPSPAASGRPAAQAPATTGPTTGEVRRPTIPADLAGIASPSAGAGARVTAATAFRTPSPPAPPTPEGEGPYAYLLTFSGRDELRGRLATELQYGGVFVRHPTPPAVGTVVRLQLTLSDPPATELLEAKVIHRTAGDAMSTGFAAEFLDSAAAISRVRKMLR